MVGTRWMPPVLWNLLYDSTTLEAAPITTACRIPAVFQHSLPILASQGKSQSQAAGQRRCPLSTFPTFSAGTMPAPSLRKEAAIRATLNSRYRRQESATAMIHAMKQT